MAAAPESGLRSVMTERAIRSARNVPGPFYSTGQCIACGAPELEAPDLLAQWTGDDTETYFTRQPETPDEIERACCALEVCCVDALRYGGTDPAILRRLGNLEELCDHPLPGGPLRTRTPGLTGVRRPWWQFWKR
jgi:hypothetical protein